MWSVAVILFLQTGASPCPSPSPPPEPPSFIVQAVDSTWLPLPGMQVTVIPSSRTSSRQTGMTNRGGFAKFWLLRNAEYAVEVDSPGFKRKRIKNVRIGPPHEYTPTAYVQVQLEVASPKVTIE